MKKVIATKGAPAAIGAYSQGAIAGNMIFVSGQLPIDMASGEVPADFKKQVAASLSNCKAIIEEAGSSMDNVVKVGVFLKDLNMFADLNEVYGTFFQEPYPARFAVEVARLPKDVLVEIDMIATL